MNKILIYMLIKHKFIWDEVYCTLKNKEQINNDQVNELCNGIKCHYITIIDDIYPYYLRTVYKPPFAVFYHGNFDLMDKKHICIESVIIKEDVQCLKFLANNDYVLCFRYENLNPDSLNLLIKNNLPFIVYVDNMESIINNEGLIKTINWKQCCFVSETYGYDQKISPRFLYGTNNPVIFFDDTKFVNDETKEYLINQNIKIYLYTNKIVEISTNSRLKLKKIKNFQNFKIVFINKN